MEPEIIVCLAFVKGLAIEQGTLGGLHPLNQNCGPIPVHRGLDSDLTARGMKLS